MKALNIKYLERDSQFFEKKIGALTVESADFYVANSEFSKYSRSAVLQVEQFSSYSYVKSEVERLMDSTFV